MSGNRVKKCSYAEWHGTAVQLAEAFRTGELRTEFRGVWYRTHWPEDGRVRLFREDGVDDSAVAVVESAFRHIAKQIGLVGFHIASVGRNSRIERNFRDSLVGDFLDDNFLARLSLRDSENRGTGNRSVDIVITKRPFSDDSISWGASSFRHGMVSFALCDGRQEDLPFLWKVALHEFGHLFGLPWHCDEHCVEGYPHQPECLMHYECPSEEMCPKCLDFIKRFWETLLKRE